MKNSLEIYTIKEASTLLKLSPQTIRKLIKDGKIQCFKAGKSIRISSDSIMKFMQTSQE